MKFIPFDQLTLELPASCQSALNCIDKNTHESSLGKSFNPLYKAFGGIVNETGFKIRRSVEYQNSFSPILVGAVFSDNEQCSIHIKMRMHHFVLAFMLVWLSGALLMTFGFFAFAISGTNALITFLIGYGLMIHSFNKEANKAKEELGIIFKELY